MQVSNNRIKSFVTLFIFWWILFFLGFSFSIFAPKEPVNNPSSLPELFVKSIKNFLGSNNSSGDTSWNSINFFKNSSIGKLNELNLEPLVQAYSDVEKNFYGFSTLQKNTIVEGMIKGMADSLWDKHTVYFNKEESQDFNESIAWNFEGIGAFVWKTQSGVLIRHVFDGSPAKESKIEDGDIVTHINTEPVIELTLENAVKKIRWPAGTEVLLKVLRHSDKWDSVLDFSVTRRSVKIPSVLSEMWDDKIAHITIGVFGTLTTRDFLSEYMKLQTQGMKWLIIDLRDNPGGLLTTSISMLENFIWPGKLLLETKWVRPELAEKFYSQGGELSSKIPVVVLVNENSASASEIFAGALQEYDRALLIWNKTYGKGSVQEIFNLWENGEIKITIAKWYTPKWKWIDGIGIMPDIIVPVLIEDIEKKKDAVLEKWKEMIWKLQKNPDISEFKKSSESGEKKENSVQDDNSKK